MFAVLCCEVFGACYAGLYFAAVGADACESDVGSVSESSDEAVALA